MRNPYPESVFLPMDLGEASLILQQAGISPDRVFGNWGRKVWDDAREATLKEVGEWLIAHKESWWLDANNKIVRIGRVNVADSDLEAFMQGKMPEEGEK